MADTANESTQHSTQDVRLRGAASWDPRGHWKRQCPRGLRTAKEAEDKDYVTFYKFWARALTQKRECLDHQFPCP